MEDESEVFIDGFIYGMGWDITQHSFAVMLGAAFQIGIVLAYFHQVDSTYQVEGYEIDKYVSFEEIKRQEKNLI